MKNKILLYLIVLLSAVLGCIRSFNSKTSFFINEEIIIEETKEEFPATLIAVKDVSNDTIESYDMEEYLIGVVAGEMPASFNEEALKAQAVAARTYAYYKMQTSNGNFDITNDATTQVHLTNEQMYQRWQEGFNKYYERVKKAVIDTRGEVITYQSQIIPAYYFAMSNGYTENSELVFSEEKDYLKSVPSPENKENYEYEVTFTKKDFCNKLQINCEKIEVNNIVRTNTNRITSITINNEEFNGKTFKYLLNIRSTDFDLLIGDNIKIITRGFGHGVGMSQYGANNLANSGYSYQEILAHYYTNTKITNIGSII